MTTLPGDGSNGSLPETTAIFVQAPADVAYALTIADAAARKGVRVQLLVVNVRAVYEYLSELELPGIELSFIPYLLQPMPRSPWALMRVRRQLSAIFTERLAGRNVTETWFFCADWDAQTPYFLKRLANTSRIFFADQYGVNEPQETRWPATLAVKWLVLCFVTGVSFGFCRETCETGAKKVWRTTFNPVAVGASKTHLAPTLSRFPLPIRLQQPLVILMDSNEQASPDIVGYAEAASGLLKELQSRNLNVVLKAHPRVGHSAFLNGFQLPSLPAGCPLELFDLRSVSALIGVSSLGLSAAAKAGVRAISLLYMIDFIEEDKREFWRAWVDRHSDGKVLFPQDRSESLRMMERPESANAADSMTMNQQEKVK